MLRPYVRMALNVDPEQLGGAPLGERLEPRAGPEHRPRRELVHEPVGDTELTRERGDIRLCGEEPVGATLHDEPVRTLRNGHAARPPPALEHDHVSPCLPQLPRRRQPGEPGPHDDDCQAPAPAPAPAPTHPRSIAALRAIAASASTSRGSSLSDSVRSRWTPSRAASARYITSTSYKISTWSHTNPMGTMRTASWLLAASSVITALTSGPSHGSGVAPALWYATRHSGSPTSFATAAALASSSSG